MVKEQKECKEYFNLLFIDEMFFFKNVVGL